MSLENLMCNFESKVSEYLEKNFKEVKAEELGIDPRGSYLLKVNEEGIMVAACSDRSMQYYAGFEYVDKEYREEYGRDWVFYSAQDSRVRRHLSRVFNNLRKYED